MYLFHLLNIFLLSAFEMEPLDWYTEIGIDDPPFDNLNGLCVVINRYWLIL